MLELGSLVRRDHDDLHYALRVLADPLSDDVYVLGMLDRLCTRLPAHIEAEGIVLARMLGEHQPPALYLLASQVTAAHLAQQTALAELARLRPGTAAFRERARYLRHLVVHHAEHEAACLHPALPDHLPRDVHRALAEAYASRRDRLLGIEPELRHVG